MVFNGTVVLYVYSIIKYTYNIYTYINKYIFIVYIVYSNFIVYGENLLIICKQTLFYNICKCNRKTTFVFVQNNKGLPTFL